MGVIYRYNGMEKGELRWQGVPVRAYGPENSSADRATRQILIGTGENSPNFHMRYFAVQPGGYTSLDQHPHEHGVYVLHGRARRAMSSIFLGMKCTSSLRWARSHLVSCVSCLPNGE